MRSSLDLSVGRWSSVRATLFQVTDDVSEPEDPSDDVVQCFQDYEDADSITTLHNDYFTCDCCDVAWTKYRLDLRMSWSYELVTSRGRRKHGLIRS